MPVIFHLQTPTLHFFLLRIPFLILSAYPSAISPLLDKHFLLHSHVNLKPFLFTKDTEFIFPVSSSPTWLVIRITCGYFWTYNSMSPTPVVLIQYIWSRVHESLLKWLGDFWWSTRFRNHSTETFNYFALLALFSFYHHHYHYLHHYFVISCITKISLMGASVSNPTRS